MLLLRGWCNKNIEYATEESELQYLHDDALKVLFRKYAKWYTLRTQ